MSDAVSHDGPRGAPSKKDLPEAFGGRRGAEPELLRISEAVACLEAGMYGNFRRGGQKAKKHYRMGAEKGGRGQADLQSHPTGKIISVRSAGFD